MHLRDLTRFLAELAENNNRPWFVMNKPRYDILRAEFLTLVTRLIDDLGQFDPAVAHCNPKKALFRINRDMRFAHDKSPYKTTFSASIVPLGRKKPSEGGGPAYYFHIDAEGKLLFAAGEYMPPADRLRAIRKHIIGDAAGFAKLMNSRKLRAGFGGLLQEGKLSRPPKGFAPDAPHMDCLKLKSLILVSEPSLAEQFPDDLEAELVLGFKTAYPFVSWLRGAT
jgi:uncharacterized protein (TIGR02453 family)